MPDWTTRIAACLVLGILYATGNTPSQPTQIACSPPSSLSKPDQPLETALRVRKQLEAKTNAFFRLINNKTPHAKKPDLPLAFDFFGIYHTKAVYLVSENIWKPKYRISERTHRYFLKELGISLNACCHWAIAVVDRYEGTCVRYDLMSDQRLGKNELRAKHMTEPIVHEWLTCSYIGETTKSYVEIRKLGNQCIVQNPRYDLLMSSCQTFLENLVRLICDGKIIDTPTAWRELKQAVPVLAAYWYVTWKTSETILKMTSWFGQNLKAVVEEDVRQLKRAFEDY